METIKVLVVDDESSIRAQLNQTLTFGGFTPHSVATSQEALEAVKVSPPDFFILDINMPAFLDKNTENPEESGRNEGLALAKELRRLGHTAPILFLTARDDRETEASGLTFWGDDYVVKPWSNAALLARIKAILRRSGNDAHRPRFLTVGEVSIDEDAHEVTIAGTPVELSPTEYKLLSYFMENPNRVLSKAQILDYVWEYDFNGEMGIVESYVSYLRRKLDPLTKEPVLITKRGVGYMFKSN